MAPHAKYLAIYEKPFWRDLGLSGEARSTVGVLGEFMMPRCQVARLPRLDFSASLLRPVDVQATTCCAIAAGHSSAGCSDQKPQLR
jgi:hypothetical protein